MKSKLTNRILAALCVAIVLSVLLALTSFAAEIKGGFGMIEGVDDTYKAASATINADGTALKVDTANAIVLDANANKELAGLYAVSNDNFTTQTFVYVYGLYPDRKELGELSGSTPVATKKGANGEQWIPGTLLGGNWYAGNAFVCDWTYYVASPKDLDQAIKTNNTAKATELRQQSQEVIQGINYRYAYTAKEILPVSELVSMQFSRSKQNGVMNVTATASKLELYVADLEGNINVYTGYGQKYGVLGDIMNGASFETYNIQEIAGLPEEGYVIAYKYYPMGVTELENIVPPSGTTSSSGHFSINVRVPHTKFPGTYEIAKPPKMEAPTGIIVEGTTFNGLDETNTYEIAPYTILGADSTKAVQITGVTEFDISTCFETPVGLYGMYVVGDEYLANSDPVIIYIYSDYNSRSKLGEVWEAGDIDIMSGNPISEAWIGHVKHASGSSQFALGYLSHNSAFFTQHNLIADSHFDQEFVRGLYNAEDDAAKQAIVDKFSPNYRKLVYKYGLTEEEIIPVKDIYEFNLSYSGGVVAADFAFTTKNSIFRFVAHVMSEDGTISEYIADLPYPEQKFNANSPTKFTIDFADDSLWNEPVNQNGYLLAYEYYPFYGLTKAENFEITGNVPDLSKTGSECVAYRARGQAFNPSWTIKENAPKPNLASFPIIEGGHGEISGLNPKYEYEYRMKDEATGEWGAWEDVPVGVTAFRVTKEGTYKIRAKDTVDFARSQTVEIVVTTYSSEYKPFKSQIVTMHLPSDFVELSAEYEMDVTVKKWVSSLALENIKTLAPEANITIVGDEYKFIVTAKNINLDGNKTHYFDMSVLFNGESRFDNVYENFKALAGERLLKEVFFESTSALPFEEAQFMVFVGEDKTGADVELRSYNSRINKLRKVETSTVIDGWVTFTNYSVPYVILQKN